MKNIKNNLGFILGIGAGVLLAAAQFAYALSLPVTPSAGGGTGTSTPPTADQILIGGNTSGRYDVKLLTAGSNITIATSSGKVLISATGSSSASSTNLSLSGALWIGGLSTTTGGIQNVATKYQINSSDVLTSNTLGSGILTSSLTSVGALDTGSIAANFGAINVGSDAISGGAGSFSSLTNSGLATFNGGASTTLLSVYSQFFAGATATTTITGKGFLGVASTTPWGVLSVNANDPGLDVPLFSIGSTTATKFIVTNAGVVGIGVLNPVANITTSILTAEGGDVLVGNEANSAQSIFLRRNGGNVGGLGTQISGMNIWSGTQTVLNDIIVSSGPLMVIGAQATPTAEFQIQGNTKIGVPLMSVSTSTPTATTTVFTIDKTGYTGIGTSTPWGQLSVNPTSLGVGVPEFVVGSTTATRFLISNNGNVGVASTSPGSLFAINGVANFTTATTSFTSSGGIDLANGCYSDGGTCLQTIISSASAYKAAVKYASTSTLPTNVYNNGASGVGATITGVANGAFYIDGNTPSVGDRVLVKNESTGANNGIYTVTTLGVSLVSPFVLTRATDYNSSTDVFPGVANFTNSGTVNANTCWILSNSSAITIGTTALTYDDACGAGSFTAGTGINISGTTISFSAPASSALSIPYASTTALSNLGVASTTALNVSLNSGFGTTTPLAKIDVAGAIVSEEASSTDTSSLTIDWSKANQQRVFLVTNTTLTFANQQAGAGYRLVACQDGTGSRTITWPVNTLWSGGTAPTLTTTASKCDLFTFTATYASSSILSMFGGSVLNF